MTTTMTMMMMMMKMVVMIMAKMRKQTHKNPDTHINTHIPHNCLH